MRKGKFKALVLLVTFLLVMAAAITLLLSMESERKEVAQKTRHEELRRKPRRGRARTLALAARPEGSC